jgi:hypothetical protein
VLIRLLLSEEDEHGDGRGGEEARGEVRLGVHDPHAHARDGDDVRAGHREVVEQLRLLRRQPSEPVDLVRARVRVKVRDKVGG